MPSEIPDHELRGLILIRYYRTRRGKQLHWQPTDSISSLDFARISTDLASCGLIEYDPGPDDDSAWGAPGTGFITTLGIDVVEGQKVSPIAITLPA